MAKFEAAYKPGTLSAVIYDRTGAQIAESELRTTDTDTLALKIQPEQDHVQAGSLLYVPVRLQDAHGTIDFADSKDIRVEVTGGELLALGSADPESTERFDINHAKAWHGEILAVVRAGCSTGTIMVHAQAEGLDDTMTAITVE